MNKKGFTLIEVLSVITIIAIIIIIAVPSVNYLSNRSNKKVIEAQEKEFVDVAKTFVGINEKNFEKEFEKDSTKCYFLSLDDMQNIDLIYGIPSLPSKSYNGENGVKVSYNESIKYEYADVNEDNCDNVLDVAISDVVYDKIEIGQPGFVDDKDYNYLYNGYNKDDNVTIDLPEHPYIFPVIYDETCDRGNGCWRKADTSKAWYDYSKGRWANIVKVKGAGSYCEIQNTNCYDDIKNRTVDYYKTHDNVAISLDDIEAFYVYIPRFDYKIEGDYGIDGTQENPGTITIQFNDNLDDVKTGDAKNEFLTHPAFVYENVESENNITETKINGFWVEKFENGVPYKTTGLREKGWRYSYTGYLDDYGNSVSWEYDNLIKGMENMISNYEWGAIAYLSQSQYGVKNNESSCPNGIIPATANAYVTVSGTYSGYSSNDNNFSIDNGLLTLPLKNISLNSYDGKCIQKFHPVTDRWSDNWYMGEGVATGLYNAYPIYGSGSCETGLCGSTTGTVYGVYDMVGGLPEYVFASMALEYQGKTYAVSPDYSVEKYKDIANTARCFCKGETTIIGKQTIDDTGYRSDRFSYGVYNRYDYNGSGKIGDATIETDSWFNNNNSFMKCYESCVTYSFSANNGSSVALIRGTSNIFDYRAESGNGNKATSRNTYNSFIW